jgi:hypothetical protein
MSAGFRAELYSFAAFRHICMNNRMVTYERKTRLKSRLSAF